MNSQAGSARFAHLDGLRGLAASIVVVCHFASAFLPFSAFGGKTVIHYPWEYLLLHTPLGISIAGHFAVCLFFLMSGFVLAAPMLARQAPLVDLVAAILKRPFRLGGVVLGTSLLSLVLWHLDMYRNLEASSLSGSEWWVSFWNEQPPSLNHLFTQLFQGPFDAARLLNQPLWTIERELWGSWLVFGLLLLRPAPLRWLLTLAFTLWYARNLTQCFLIGLLLAEVHQQLVGRSRVPVMSGWLCGLLLVVALVCGSFPKYADPGDIPHTLFAWSPVLPWLGGGWPMFGALAIMLAALYHPSLQRLLAAGPLLFLGRVSYSLYGVHFLILGSLSSSAFIHFTKVSGYPAGVIAALIALLLGTLGGAVVIDRFIDRPALALSQAIGRKVHGFSAHFGKSK
jgi:peptidoglycan/LPS O-acetylase OafA/YrhL